MLLKRAGMLERSGVQATLQHPYSLDLHGQKVDERRERAALVQLEAVAPAPFAHHHLFVALLERACIATTATRVYRMSAR